MCKIALRAGNIRKRRAVLSVVCGGEVGSLISMNNLSISRQRGVAGTYTTINRTSSWCLEVWNNIDALALFTLLVLPSRFGDEALGI